jgi:hypothetical protein
MIGEIVKECRCATHIRVRIARNLIHRLRGSGLGGQMKNVFCAIESCGPVGRDANVSPNHLYIRALKQWQRTKSGHGTMNLGTEVIEQENAVALLDKLLCDVDSDEPQTAGNENPFHFSPLELRFPLRYFDRWAGAQTVSTRRDLR